MVSVVGPFAIHVSKETLNSFGLPHSIQKGHIGINMDEDLMGSNYLILPIQLNPDFVIGLEAEAPTS
ncbi:hypothetical protein TorRG33x02_087920 [Trema orientale]|uniref:Uncharacterized protein n=1 Tax=Trema orientale TaxID=63057 RepID=A0A2P5FBU7_TREOI|nr:hypothetical protein TorRG33x02_087920 [Trema orientale]